MKKAVAIRAASYSSRGGDRSRPNTEAVMKKSGGFSRKSSPVSERHHQVAGPDHLGHDAEAVGLVRLPGLAAEQAGSDPEDEEQEQNEQGAAVHVHGEEGLSVRQDRRGQDENFLSYRTVERNVKMELGTWIT